MSNKMRLLANSMIVGALFRWPECEFPRSKPRQNMNLIPKVIREQDDTPRTADVRIKCVNASLVTCHQNCIFFLA
jgi:hypothetical protein